MITNILGEMMQRKRDENQFLRSNDAKKKRRGGAIMSKRLSRTMLMLDICTKMWRKAKHVFLANLSNNLT